MRRLLAALLLLAAPAAAQVGQVPGVSGGGASGGGSGTQSGFAQSSGASNFATLSAEMMTNAAFNTDISSWTGANWAWSAPNKAVHTPGATTALSQNVAIVSGTWYRITFTTVAGTAGSIDISLGAQSVRAAVITTPDSNHLTSEEALVQANVTGTVALTATPTTDFDGGLDYFGMVSYVGEAPKVFDMRDVTGTSFMPVRGMPDFANTGNVFWGFDAGRYTINNGETYGIGTFSLRHVGTTGGTGGYRNTAMGAFSMLNTTIGIENTCMGDNCLQTLTSGTFNVAMGRQAFSGLRQGTLNVGIGYRVDLGAYANWDTYVGAGAAQQATATAAVPGGNSFNVAIGTNAGFNFNGSNNFGIVTANAITMVGAQTGFCSATQRTNSGVFGNFACVDADNTYVIGSGSTTDVILGNGTTPGPTARLNAKWVLKTGDAILSADYTNATASFTSIGLTASVVNAKKYGFRLVLQLADSTAADGVALDFSAGSATSTTLRITCILSSDTGTTVAQANAVSTAFGTVINATAMASANQHAYVCEGTFFPSSTGTFIPRARQNTHSTGTLTIFKGSYIEMLEMP